MRIFKQGDFAFVVDREGEGRQVRVMGQQANGSYLVEGFNSQGLPSGALSQVENGKLFAPKGPFFDIRGQVLTASSIHPNEVGQIVGTATSKSGKLFFNVCFDDGKCEWFNDDQIFIDDNVKQAYDKA